MTRRRFLATAGACGLLPAVSRGACLLSDAGPMPRAPGVSYRFFDAIEAAIVEAACERLIPASEASPGAQDAGVPLYLDEQLAGPWGDGKRVHRLGAWQPGTPWHDPCRPSAPGDYFRAALHEIHRQFENRGTSFAACAPAVQEAYLRSLESGSTSLRPVSAQGFFDLLLKLTLEGYFRNPQPDAPRSTLAWTMTGFAGACMHETASLGA